jgi:serine protease AprX
MTRLAKLGILACIGLAAALPASAAAAGPARSGDAVVQFSASVPPAAQRAAVLAVGGRVTRDLHVIHGLGARLPAGASGRLARVPGVRAVTANAAMRTTAEPAAAGGRWSRWHPEDLGTAFVQSTRADKAWTDPNSRATGAGVTVAVIDTGVAGELPDFRISDADPASRVIATAVTNPDATTATDLYGHGTHVAGLVAGNSKALPADDPLNNRYIGTAPDASLVAIKASDDHGNSSLIDVIAGVQFAVDHRDDYGIRVINLSMSSAVAQSYRTDPLDAAVEAAWFKGIVVVAAAGNRGTAADAVSYAPANDPYVITVGGVDDHGSKDTLDDTLAGWSSRGVTQDGFAKPDLVAPGAHIVAPLAPGSDLPGLCPTCVVDGRYFRMGGTSMAAPIVAGIAADVISAHPDWTPAQVKGAMTYYGDGSDPNVRLTADGAHEVAADNAVNASDSDGELASDEGLTPNEFVDASTGEIDYTRASWGRASWSEAAGALRASWGRASWGCVCSDTTGGALPTRASWGRASWTSFFGETPGEFGELGGGASGAARHDEPAASPDDPGPANDSVPASVAARAPAAAPASGAVEGAALTSPRPSYTRYCARQNPARHGARKSARERCVGAMKALAQGRATSSRQACRALSRAPEAGRRRSAFGLCVAAGTRLKTDLARRRTA